MKPNARGYEVVGKLGTSGVCEVLLAQRQDAPGKVVLQALRPKHLAEAQVLRAFRQQAERCLELNHAHIARHFELGVLPDGRPYLASEHVDGETFADRLRRAGTLGWREIAQWMYPICDALESARERGVTHGNVRANTLVIEAGNHVRVTSFGLVTPSGRPKGAADDVRAVGLVMFELLTGTLPLIAPGAPLPPVPPESGPLASVVRRCLGGEYDNAGEVAAALGSILVVPRPAVRLAAATAAAPVVIKTVRSRKDWGSVVGGCLLALVIGAVAIALLGPGAGQAAEVKAVSVVEPAPAPMPKPVEAVGPIAPPSLSMVKVEVPAVVEAPAVAVPEPEPVKQPAAKVGPQKVRKHAPRRR